MPEVTPTTPPTPAPTPSAVATVAATKSTSSVSPPVVSRDDKGRFTKNQTSAVPRLPEPPKLDVAKALGIKESPAISAANIINDAKKRLKIGAIEPAASLPPVKETPAPAPASVEPPPVEEPKEVTPTPAPAPAPAKVKVGDKEYSPEELQKHLQELEELKKAPAPAPAPAPQVSEEPQPAPPAPLSPEEIAQRQQEFVQRTIEALDAPLTETELDTLLAGGQEALQLFTNLRKRDMATAIMRARVGIAEGINPILQNLFQAVAPLVQQHESVQRYSVEQSFVTKHKDFVPHLDRARAVAEELYRRYPQQISRMTPDQFVDEVARQTDLILTNEYKRWNPNTTTTWRDAARAAAAPAPAPAPAPAAPPQAPAAPAPARRVVARPPAATVPQGSSGTAPASWDAMVASSLRPR